MRTLNFIPQWIEQCREFFKRPAIKNRIDGGKRIAICTIPIIASLIVLGGALLTQSVLVGSELNYVDFSFCLRPIDVGCFPNLTVPSQEHIHRINGARIGWVSVSFLHAVVCFGAIVCGFFIVVTGPSSHLHQRMLGSKEQPPKLWSFKRIGITTIALFISLVAGFAIVFMPHNEIADQLIEMVQAAEPNGSVVGPIVRYLNVFTFASAIFLVIMSSFTLYISQEYMDMLANRNHQNWPKPGELKSEKELEGEEDKAHMLTHYLAEQSRECKLLFYLGAAVLVTAIMRLHAFYGWAISYYPSDESAGGEGLRVLLQNVATAWGIYATLALLAMYVPVYAIMRGRGFHLAHCCEPHGCRADHASWLEKNGLLSSNIQYVSKFAAILSPFVVGQVSELLKGI